MRSIIRLTTVICLIFVSNNHARADLYAWTYATQSDTIIGSGTITSGPNGGPITAITGTYNGEAISGLSIDSSSCSIITGMFCVYLNALNGDDILNYPSQPYLDTDGVTFLVGSEDVELFYSNLTGYYNNIAFMENSLLCDDADSCSANGDFLSGTLFDAKQEAQNIFQITPVPLPPTWTLMLAAFAGIGWLRNRL
jgi:hypothetical protein